MRFRSLFPILVLGLTNLPFSNAWSAPRTRAKKPKPAIVSVARDCAPELESAARRDSSAIGGPIAHSEHFVDLILAGTPGSRHWGAFQSISRELLQSIRTGELARTNEKFDGSPAVILGFTADGARPFVAYKNDIPDAVPSSEKKSTRKKRQRLVTSVEEAEKGFPKLSFIYGPTIQYLAPVLKKLSAEFGDTLFQGDLLFTPASENEDPMTGRRRLEKNPDVITLTPNVVSYRIPRAHPLYGQVARARVGLVIHTVGKRIVDSDGVLRMGPLESSERELARKKIEAFVEKLQAPDIFVLHPWSTGVSVGKEVPASSGLSASVLNLLEGIETRLRGLFPEFTRVWSQTHLQRFRIFFNSGVSAHGSGGIYRWAAENRPLDFESLKRRYRGWVMERIKRLSEPESYAAQMEALFAEQGKDLESFVRAYYEAIRVQYVLEPHLREAFRSKLGGGEVEGVMLETSDTIVKFVDRLNFTTRNNAVNRDLRRGRIGGSALGVDSNLQQTPRDLSEFPEPFNRWRPGTAFFILKGQPVHSGHIRTVKRALELNGGTDVAVVASIKKSNLAASEWGDLGLTETKKELLAQSYTYVFTPELKREILEAGLAQSGAEIYLQKPDLLWSYLATAKALGYTGKVKLVMGQKEWDQARYDDQLEEHREHLEPLIVEMQHDGISATRVRHALRDAVLGDRSAQTAAKAVLEASLTEIPTKKRRRELLNKMIFEWRSAHEAATCLLEKPAAALVPEISAPPAEE